MPEGDTIFKLAAHLGPALQGRELLVDSVITGVHADLAGRRIGGVFAHGKHLFIELDDQCLLRSHLGMWGSWHAYAPGESWQKPVRQASIVLDVGDRVFVCFNALQVEILRSAGVRRRALGQLLGPDLLGPSPVFDDIVARAHAMLVGSTPITDVLLDQRIATGIGNVYKSEVLFVCSLHPLTPLAGLADDALTGLYREAATLLGRNVGRGPRVTRRAGDEAGRLWTYGRTAQPCLRCDARIIAARLGRRQRSTFWCPECQPAPAVSDL